MHYHRRQAGALVLAAKSNWLLQIPEILDRLASLEIPVVDRTIMERLFGVKRREAINLLHRFGGYRSGNTFLAGRLGLIRQLQLLQDSPEFSEEHHRRTKLSQELDQTRCDYAAARILLPVTRGVANFRTTLPEGVHLQPSRLQVDFSGAEDLLTKLYAIAQSAARDYERFRARLDGSAKERADAAG